MSPMPGTAQSPPGAFAIPVSGSHHAWAVEDHGDRDGKHDELHA